MGKEGKKERGRKEKWARVPARIGQIAVATSPSGSEGKRGKGEKRTNGTAVAHGIIRLFRLLTHCGKRGEKGRKKERDGSGAEESWRASVYSS